jgi:hypothetical protein
VFRALAALAIVVTVLGAGERGSNAGILAQSGRRLVVVAEWPDRLEAALNGAGGQGYTCGAVARPVPPLQTEEAITWLVRSAGAGAVDYRVVSGHARFDRAALERAVTAAGDEGFAVCGLTVAQRPGVRTGAGNQHVLVFSRERAQPVRRRLFRVIFTSGVGSEWSRVEAALREGFTIARVAWSQPERATLPEVVFLAERDAESGAGTASSTLESDGEAAGLTKRVTRRVAEGYRVEAAWASPTSVSVLMTRRAGSPSSSPDYVVAASSTGSFSPAPNSGLLLASVPFKGMRYAIHDRSRPGAYTTFEREHAPFTQLLGSPGAEARNLEQALAERFESGRERPVDVVYRETSARGRLRAEAIFDRDGRP